MPLITIKCPFTWFLKNQVSNALSAIRLLLGPSSSPTPTFSGGGIPSYYCCPSCPSSCVFRRTKEALLVPR